MRLIAVVACLWVVCQAQTPQPCVSPPLLSGALSVFTASEKLSVYAKYSYDALGERIRLSEVGSYNNKSFSADLLLLFRKSVMYKIDYQKQTCLKRPLNTDFHPMAIPKNATLLGQSVLGSSSGPMEGLLVDTWTGEKWHKGAKAKYMSTVTAIGCVPISSYFHTDKTGWMVTSLFNNVKGLVDPEALIPPPFCTNAQPDGQEPVTFFSLF